MTLFLYLLLKIGTSFFRCISEYHFHQVWRDPLAAKSEFIIYFFNKNDKIIISPVLKKRIYKKNFFISLGFVINIRLLRMNWKWTSCGHFNLKIKKLIFFDYLLFGQKLSFLFFFSNATFLLRSTFIFIANFFTICRINFKLHF